jgi:hypothetical protein
MLTLSKLFCDKGCRRQQQHRRAVVSGDAEAAAGDDSRLQRWAALEENVRQSMVILQVQLCQAPQHDRSDRTDFSVGGHRLGRERAHHGGQVQAPVGRDGG